MKRTNQYQFDESDIADIDLSRIVHGAPGAAVITVTLEGKETLVMVREDILETFRQEGNAPEFCHEQLTPSWGYDHITIVNTPDTHATFAPTLSDTSARTTTWGYQSRVIASKRVEMEMHVLEKAMAAIRKTIVNVETYSF